MKNKYLRHLTSTASGTIVIYILMQTKGLIERSQMDYDELRAQEHFVFTDLFLIGFFFFIVATIQILFVMPVFDFWTRKNKMTNRNILLLGTLLTLIIGLVFGISLGQMKFGLVDILETIGLGVFIFGTFYTADFLTFKRLTV